MRRWLFFPFPLLLSVATRKDCSQAKMLTFFPIENIVDVIWKQANVGQNQNLRSLLSASIKPLKSKRAYVLPTLHINRDRTLRALWLVKNPCFIRVYIITKSTRALWLVDQLRFIVPVNPWKNRASSKLLYKSNRPQVSMVYRQINHLGCW